MGVGAALYMYDVVVKSSRSLSHPLVSFCLAWTNRRVTNWFCIVLCIVVKLLVHVIQLQSGLLDKDMHECNGVFTNNQTKINYFSLKKKAKI